MKLPTSSSLERGLLCAPSFLLPQVEDKGNAAARRGTLIHLFIESAIKNGRDRALEIAATKAMPKQLAEFEAIDIDRLLLEAEPGALYCEVAFAYDPEKDTARILGYSIERGYEAAGADLSREFCCSADLVSIAGESARVFDFKTGQIPVTGSRFNAQLLLGAICVSRAYGVSVESKAIAKLNGDGSWSFDSYPFDALSEVWFRDDLINLKHDAEGSPAINPSYGACRWCRVQQCSSEFWKPRKP